MNDRVAGRFVRREPDRERQADEEPANADHRGMDLGGAANHSKQSAALVRQCGSYATSPNGASELVVAPA